MLDGIRRFCTEKTQLILTTPNAFGAPNFLRYSLGKFRDGAEHVMSFNPQNLATLLDRHGYSLSELHTCFQPLSRRTGVEFQLGRRALELFPRFGGTLLAVAKVSVSKAGESLPPGPRRHKGRPLRSLTKLELEACNSGGCLGAGKRMLFFPHRKPPSRRKQYRRSRCHV